MKKLINAFKRFETNNLSHTIKLKFSRLSQNEESESKLELQDEVAKLYGNVTDMMKVLGKCIRSANQDKPIKIDVARLASKSSIGFLLSGLKGNRKVQELNLKECQLDDEDLERIAARLIEDQGITSLYLGQNQFSSVLPLIPLLRAKAHQYHIVDLSSCPVSPEQPDTLQDFTEALSQMRALSELHLSECVHEPHT